MKKKKKKEEEEEEVQFWKFFLLDLLKNRLILLGIKVTQFTVLFFFYVVLQFYLLFKIFRIRKQKKKRRKNEEVYCLKKLTISIMVSPRNNLICYF